MHHPNQSFHHSNQFNFISAFSSLKRLVVLTATIIVIDTTNLGSEEKADIKFDRPEWWKDWLGWCMHPTNHAVEILVRWCMHRPSHVCTTDACTTPEQNYESKTSRSLGFPSVPRGGKTRGHVSGQRLPDQILTYPRKIWEIRFAHLQIWWEAAQIGQFGAMKKHKKVIAP